MTPCANQISLMQSQTRLTSPKTKQVKPLNALIDVITKALKEEDTVSLVGFGTFLQRSRAARTGKNPQTGEPIQIAASNTVAFKPGKALKSAVND